jgi:HD-like signal output (HDOD) protein/DNA-binding NarL/FixJ family response regulator
MANILLLDSSEVAALAMRGILARGQHRFAVTTSVAEAWHFIRAQVKVDLLFTELKLKVKEDDGIVFIQRLRNDPFLKLLPVVVYTELNDHLLVKKALALKVQNYFTKPYSDESIFSEIAKASANPWRNLHFEEERSFCAQMGLPPDQLKQMRQDLSSALEANVPFFADCAEGKNHPEVLERLGELTERAEAAGIWGVVDYLNDLRAKAEVENWYSFLACRDELTYATRLIADHLNPDQIPEGFISEQERKAQQEAKERAIWLGADVGRGPLVEAAEVLLRVDKLPGCPVVDSVVAAFKMTANGQATSLAQVTDLVSKDPGLTAQVLIAANRLEREDMMTVIEDPKIAIGLLGNIKLSALGQVLPIAEERHMNIAPLSWPQFWMFQMGVAQLSPFICRNLELRELAAQAHTAGLLHDIGKLLLLHLHPFAFQAMVGYARKNSLPLREAEVKFMGCTTREMGDRFARKKDLPDVYRSVIRWVETPEIASDYRELVAIVSIARHICLHNHVGHCGDSPKDYGAPIEGTAAWSVLRERLFPSFNLRKFELLAQGFCRDLKQELSGRIKQ